MASDTNKPQDDYAKPCEWVAYRVIITDLYIKQRMKLREIMKLMIEEHDFHATPKMYKSRLTKWGLRKNLSKRTARGDHRANPCQNYWLEWLESQIDDQAYGASRRPRLPQLQFSSRSPSTLVTSALPNRRRLLARTPGSTHAQLFPLAMPDVVRAPEMCMHFAKRYLHGAFSTGLWTVTADVTSFDQGIVKLNGWSDNFNPGKQFLRQSKPKKALRVFRHCFNQHTAMIAEQDPRLIISVYLSLICSSTQFPLLAQSIIRHLTDTARSIHGASHPLSQMLAHTARMSIYEFRQNARHILDCFFDHFEPLLDQSSQFFIAITEHRVSVASFLEGCDLLGFYVARPILERLLHGYERQSNFFNAILTRIEIASLDQRNGRTDRARDDLIKLLNCVEIRGQTYLIAYANYIMLRMARKERDLNGMMRHVDEITIRCAMRPDGIRGRRNQDDLCSIFVKSATPLVLSWLDTALREAGRNDEADGVLRRQDAAVNEICAKEEEGSSTEPVIKFDFEEA